MRKTILFLAVGFLFSLGCNKPSHQIEDSLVPEEETFFASQRKCAADEVLQEQLKADPSLRNRMDLVEEFTRRVAANP
ncbi:MAG: hypothetical protein ACXWV1_08655, partial [Chitinophagaceae bacterium]